MSAAVSESTRPVHVARADEQELFLLSHRMQAPLLLLGPSGCGKTQLVEAMAERLGRPLITVTCHDDLVTADLVGRYLMRVGDVVWRDGPLVTAMRRGALCYLDEIVEARSDTLAVLHAVADHRRALRIEPLDEEVQAAPGFQLVASYNPRPVGSPKELRTPLRQRFVTVHIDYLAAADEQRVVSDRSGVDRATAADLVAVAATLRHASGKDQQGRFDAPSTRAIVLAAGLVVQGASVRQAVDACLIAPLTSDTAVAGALRELASATLPPVR